MSRVYMLTKRQKEILDFVESYSQKKGYSPSFEEIRKRLKLASVSTIHFHISKLKEGGYLEKIKNKARAISVTSNKESLIIKIDQNVKDNKEIKYLVHIPSWGVEIEAKNKTEAMAKVGKLYDDYLTTNTGFEIINIKQALARKKCYACGQKEDPDGRCRCVNQDAW